ncbi:DUF2917 domain-containing protein [Rhodoferax sp. PAMC 29310]|uniref:DUF2917 domain-containing protein n=1 Tax=Rhodoferax sp. PAMC 29310 TaxID=2822760 RepID=UPI001B31D6EE
MLTPSLLLNHSPGHATLSVCGQLAARQTLRLCPRGAGVLRIGQGRLWLTLDGPHHGPVNAWGDHVVYAGQSMALLVGQRAVVEAWPVTEGAVSQFEWLPAPTVCDALASPVQQPLGARLQEAARSWQGFRCLLGL